MSINSTISIKIYTYTKYVCTVCMTIPDSTVQCPVIIISDGFGFQKSGFVILEVALSNGFKLRSTSHFLQSQLIFGCKKPDYIDIPVHHLQ